MAAETGVADELGASPWKLGQLAERYGIDRGQLGAVAGEVWAGLHGAALETRVGLLNAEPGVREQGFLSARQTRRLAGDLACLWLTRTGA